jgi:hypothetical protein
MKRCILTVFSRIKFANMLSPPLIAKSPRKSLYSAILQPSFFSGMLTVACSYHRNSTLNDQKGELQNAIGDSDRACTATIVKIKQSKTSQK